MFTRLEPRAEVRATRRDFAAAERADGAIEREIPQPHRFQDSPAAVAPARASCGRRGCSRQIRQRLQAAAEELRQRRARAGNLHGGDLGDVAAADAGVEGLGPQPRPAAGRAGAVASPAARGTRGCASCTSAAPARRKNRPARRNSAPARPARSASAGRRSTGRTARQPADRSPGPGPAVPPVRGRRPACSRARWPLRGSSCSDRARPGPCRRR